MVLTLAVGVVHGRVVGLVVGRTSDSASSTRAELAFLRDALNDGAGERMQELFPEGYFFSHALLGLAWCDLAAEGEADATAALAQARWALSRLESPSGTAPFSENLTPTYGIFYAGWSLLLRAGIDSLVQAEAHVDSSGLPSAVPDASASVTPGPDAAVVVSDSPRSELADAADEVASAVAAALEAGRPPFLEAYPGQAWPVDTVVALAGLRAADAVTGADHSDLVRRWVERAGAFADPPTGLLPHRVDPSTGLTLQPPRGSSQSIIQRFWPALDPAGARESYQRFHRLFVTREFGIVAVREYPHGVEGSGDVDSGPLPLGVSASATAVTIGAARANGDRQLASALAAEIDLVGVPITWDGRRRYVGGVVPVGDAFVAWARAAPLAAEHDYSAPRPLWPAWLVVPWALVFVCWGLRLRRLAR